MHSFTYCVPTQIVFGGESVEKLPELLKERNIMRVLVVCGGHSAKKSGLLDRVEGLLKAAEVKFDVLSGVQPNPRLSLAREGVKRALALSAQLILAVGGGSVIDTAKAVAHGAANPDVDIWEFWAKRAELRRTTPVGAILTIPAAGSETSDSAVLTNDELGLKRGLNTPLNRPAFAILDPALAATLPEHQAACGVTDIMMHTLDRYFNPVCDNEITDAIAEALLRVVVKNGAPVVRDRSDLHAMSEIMWCGSLSHNGLTGLGGNKDFAVHQLGHAVSEKFDIYHGDSLSCVWGSWARYVCPANPARFAQYARNVWGVQAADDEAAAQQGIEQTEAYFASLGMPVSLGQARCGVQDEAGLQELAARCSFQKTRAIGTFRKLDFDDMLKIYHMANKE
ncbi:MAG: iron-containing alcohol dehydrogenase [Clostridiales bacterium]|nr:iron-containing alcohol dehydrogenase [Clostridiales bacterium]